MQVMGLKLISRTEDTYIFHMTFTSFSFTKFFPAKPATPKIKDFHRQRKLILKNKSQHFNNLAYNSERLVIYVLNSQGQMH